MREWKYREVNEYGKRELTCVPSLSHKRGSDSVTAIRLIFSEGV